MPPKRPEPKPKPTQQRRKSRAGPLGTTRSPTNFTTQLKNRAASKGSNSGSGNDETGRRKIKQESNRILNQQNNVPPDAANGGERAPSAPSGPTSPSTPHLPDRPSSAVVPKRRKSSIFAKRPSSAGTARRSSGLFSLDATNSSLIPLKEQSEPLSAARGETRLKDRRAENLRRKQEIEEKRQLELEVKTGFGRRNLIQQKKLEEAKNRERRKLLLQVLSLGCRMQVLVNVLLEHRNEVKIHLKEMQAARIITRNLRSYAIKCYRERMKRSFHVLGTVIVTRARLWKYQRKCRAVNVVKSFLLSLEKHKEEAGVSLGIIVQCNKWRRIKQCAIAIQTFWRCRFKIIESQVQLIDLQWTRRQEALTDIEAENRYRSQKRNAEEENAKLESINRMRKLMKMPSQPLIQIESREQIKSKLLEGVDVLDYGNIAPREIRLKLIREFLKSFRKNFYEEMHDYVRKITEFEEAERARERMRVRLLFSAGENVASKWQREQGSIGEKMRDHDANVANVVNVSAADDESSPNLSAEEPTKPKFHLVLDQEVLKKLMHSGDEFIGKIRRGWSPQVLAAGDYDEFCKDMGEKIATMHCSYSKNSVFITD